MLRRRRDAQRKSAARRGAEERRELRARRPKLRGSHRLRLPESLRVLYGAGEDAERRLFQFMERGQAADEYLQSFEFADCDYCKVGWFGSSMEAPGGCQLSAVERWNFLLASQEEWREDGGKRICRGCLDEVKDLRKRAAAAADPSGVAPAASIRPVRLCESNDMDIGDTYPELDVLTFFEEEILAPIQPMVRVYTLYGTGLTEMRGHVVNLTQGGPQFVREIPARAHELNILLVRRFPRDPNRKQRVPFLASPRRLEAALDRLEGNLGSDRHLGFRQHVIPVNRENLHDYKEGEAPQGLQVRSGTRNNQPLKSRSYLYRS